MCDQINYVMLLCQAVQTTGTPSLYVCVLCLHQFGLLTWTSVFHVDVFMFQVTEAITCLWYGTECHRIMSASYHSVQNLLSSSFLSKNLKITIYRTIILPAVLFGCETWSLTMREERRQRVFENRVLRRIFGPKRDEVTGEWLKLYNEELNDLYCSSISEINPTRCNNCVYSSQWLYSTCYGWQFHPSSGVHCHPKHVE